MFNCAIQSKMPSKDKFAKKVVSTTVLNDKSEGENDKLFVEHIEGANEMNQFEDDLSTADAIELKKPVHDEYKVEYVWRNIIFFVFMHLCIPYALIRGALEMKFYLVAWHTFLGYMAGLGVTAGAHRLWSHQSYKAHWTVRLFLAFWFTVAGQNDIYEWCRDHRVHHKWSETHADPHNANRGFFFAHMGWLCVRKHKLVMIKGAC